MGPTWAVMTIRFLMLALFVFAVIKTLVMPLRRVPDDTQLARFVEEKNPGLQDRLVSAVEAIHKSKTEQVAFVHLLINDTL